MKKLSLLILFILVNLTFAFSQSCLPDGIKFTTQGAVDNFSANYPDCTVIEGDVTIEKTTYSTSITNLEGLSAITSIGGNLKIFSMVANYPFLDSFSGLDNLTSVGGDFYLRHYNGSDFSGLNQLQTIGGDFTLQYNYFLESLSDLENLTTIGGDLMITGNSILTSCGQPALCTYLSNPAGVVSIYNNASGCDSPEEISTACGVELPCLPFGNYYFRTQQQMDYFAVYHPDCTEINGDISIAGGNISSLSALSGITSVSGNLNIGNGDFGNPLLTSLNGLDQLAFVGGNLDLGYNFTLTDVSALGQLNYIGGDLKVMVDTALASLTGFNNLDSIGGSMHVYGCYNMMNFSGFDNLTHIGGNLGISSNRSQKNFSGLESLSSINGNISIWYSDSLNSLAGLDYIQPATITGLSIRSNPVLSTCEVRSICDYLSVPGGTIEIQNNATGCNNSQEVENACATAFLPCLPEGIAFTSQAVIDNFLTFHSNCSEIEGDVTISGDEIINLLFLSNIRYIGGYLKIISTTDLANLSGLDSLTFIGGGLVLGDDNKGGNAILNSLSGLNQLRQIGGDLIIRNNPVLSSLEGMGNILPESILGLTISNNASLSECDVQSICNYLTGSTAAVTINDNLTGCNSRSEVESVCSLGVKETRPEPEFSIYPNPADQMLFITSRSGIMIQETVIWNQLGQVVVSQAGSNGMIDVSILPQGMYIIEIISEKSGIRKKLIIE